MPLSGWLHINGISVTTDVQQQQQQHSLPTYDYRTKSMTSPNVPLISSANSSSIPYTTTTTVTNDRQYHQIDNKDLLKKLFVDRQIKKAKSLPGLIKGTALCRQTSVHSAQNNIHDDSVRSTLGENEDDISPSHQNHQQTNEIRRPRVSFSDFNKVQFIDHNHDNSEQSIYRRQRQRSSKKLTTIMLNNPVSPPSIQHSQTLYRPLSRQQPVGSELNIKKQQLISTPRIHSSRIANLPDILNQSLPVENSIHEKYVLQREKTLFHFPEPAAELPINSTEVSRESTRAGGARPSPVQDYYDQNNKYDTGIDNGMNTMFNSSSISSLSANRQRPPLRTISLRQQFSSPNKSKLSNFSPINQTPPITTTNPRRSASLKHSITRNHSIEDDHNDSHNQSYSSTYENRPMTAHNSSKHSKRNYVIHLNSKSPFNGNTSIDSNDLNRHYMKSNFPEAASSQRFQNLLKVVRPPYITSIHSTHHDLTSNPTNSSVRSSRTNSGRTSHDYHITPNVVYV